MRWSRQKKGKYVTIDPHNPSALGVCDESGFVFNHKDLVKQMEWRGDNLIWTGLMVGKPYIDEPSQQNRPPIIKNDPQPVSNPRLPKEYIDPESNQVLTHEQLVNKLNSEKWNSVDE